MAQIIPLRGTKTEMIRSYKGQYLRTIPRKNKSGTRFEYWFKLNPAHRDEEWDKRHPPAIRLPRERALRHGLSKAANPSEFAAAWNEAALLFGELNILRSKPEDGTEWLKGNLRWLTNAWLKSDWFKEDLAPNTQHLYKQQIDVINDWADRTAKSNKGLHPHVARMTPKAIATFLHTYDDRPVRRGHIRRVLKNLFTYSVELGIRETNPVNELVMRRTKGKKRKTILWTQDFVNKAAKWAVENDHPEAAAMVLLMWDCGRRPEDIFRLTAMTDLDQQALLNGTLNSTTRPMLYDPRERVLKGWVAKTGNYIAIPLDEPTVAAIDIICPTPTENRRHLFVHRKTGNRYHTDTWKWVWYSMRDAAGIPEIKWQNGRASSIVRNKRAGLDDSKITALSDHSNPKTVYRHYWVADDTQAAEAKKQRLEYEGRPS